MYDTSNCPYFSESCPVCDDGDCGRFECLERIEELKDKGEIKYEIH